MKKGTIKYLIILILCFTYVKSKSQNTDSFFFYSGQVICEVRNIPISFAHVINIEQKWGVVADTTGYFEIYVKEGDLLNISAIGFEFLEHEVRYNEDTLVNIYLKSRIYEIPEASIYYLGTYKDFEYKVINLDLPEVKFNPEVDKYFKYVEPSPLFVEPRVSSPASLIYVLFSKDAKDKKKYLKLEKEDKLKDKVRERYNEHIVRNITGLKLEEAIEFMKFCDFQDEYILSINDYNLYAEITLRFEAFKKSEQDSLHIE